MRTTTRRTRFTRSTEGDEAAQIGAPPSTPCTQLLRFAFGGQSVDTDGNTRRQESHSIYQLELRAGAGRATHTGRQGRAPRAHYLLYRRRPYCLHIVSRSCRDVNEVVRIDRCSCAWGRILQTLQISFPRTSISVLPNFGGFATKPTANRVLQASHTAQAGAALAWRRPCPASLANAGLHGRFQATSGSFRGHG